MTLCTVHERQAKIPLPDFDRGKMDLEDHGLKWVHKLIRFIEFCLLTITVVEQLQGDNELLVRIVAQRYIVIVSSYETWLDQQVEPMSETPEQFKVFSHKLKTWSAEFRDTLRWRLQMFGLESLLQRDATVVAQEWITATLFHIVLAALVCRYGTDTALRAVWESKQIHNWRSKGQHWIPRVAVLNLSQCAVSMSCMRWGGWPLLHEWEKDIREAGLIPEVREQLRYAEEVISNIVGTCDMNADSHSLVQIAREAVARLNMPRVQSCAGQVWQAMRMFRELKHTDQCSMCQVCFQHVVPVVPNDGTPLARLGERRVQKHVGQCAEAEMCSNMADKGQKELAVRLETCVETFVEQRRIFA